MEGDRVVMQSAQATDQFAEFIRQFRGGGTFGGGGNFGGGRNRSITIQGR